MNRSARHALEVPFRLIVCLCAAFFLLPAAVVHADGDDADTWNDWQSIFSGWQFSGTFSIDYRHHTDLFNAGDDDQYRGYLDTFLTKDRLTIGISILGANFYPREPYREFNNFVEVDRFFVDYAGETFHGVLGDYFASFERGMTLSVLRDDAIFRDSTIFGARGTFVSPSQFVELDVLTGYVTDKVTDEEDWLHGALAAIRLPGNIRLGGTFVLSDDKTDDWIEGRHELVSGFLDITELGNHIDIYGEYGIKDSELDPTEDKGHGLYINANFYSGGFTLLTEYKDYERFKYEHNNPPTADRLDELYTPDNTDGFRVMPSYYVGATDTDLFVSYSRFTSKLTDSVSEHFWGGLEQFDMFDRIYLLVWGGRRSEDNGKDENKGVLTSAIRTSKTDSIIVDFLIKYARDPFYCNTEIESALGYSFSGRYIITGLYQYSEVPVYDETDFWGGELTANITNSLTAKLFYGSLKGGQICSGGQCRYEDPFKGLKLTLVYRF